MYLRVLRYSALVCLSLGLLSLFAACASATTDSTENASSNTVVSSQNATPTSASATATATTHKKSSAQSSSTGSSSTVSTSGIPTSTPLQPTPHATTGVKVTAPIPTPTTAITSGGPLTLELACSSPQAQDGMSASDSHAKACVYTTPGAKLTITASFCNGKPDPNSALQGTFTANGKGFYEWDWTPQASCRPISSWSVSVNAQLGGASASVSQASSVG